MKTKKTVKRRGFQLPKELRGWITQSQQARIFGPRRGRMLAVLVQSEPSGRYGALAVEAAMPETSSERFTLDGFFKDHAHAVVAEGVTERKAKSAAMAFARKWQKKPDLAKCGCKEIA